MFVFAGCRTKNNLSKSQTGDVDSLKPFKPGVSHRGNSEHEANKTPCCYHNYNGFGANHQFHGDYNRRIFEQRSSLQCILLHSSCDLVDVVCGLFQFLPYFHLHCCNQGRAGLRVPQQLGSAHDHPAIRSQSKYFKCSVLGVEQAKRQIFRVKKRGNASFQKHVLRSTGGQSRSRLIG